MKKQPLIVLLPNWVGDAVRTLPALNALEQAGFALKLFIKPYLMELFKGTGFELHEIPTQWRQKILHLRQMPAKNILLFTNSLSTALLARCAGKKPIGYYTDARNLLLNTGMNKPKGLHEVEYFWNVAEHAAKVLNEKAPWPATIPSKIKWPLLSPQISQAKVKLSEAGIESPYWVLCPFVAGAGDIKNARIWPHWLEFSQYLQQREMKTIVCPGPQEEVQSHLLPGTHVVSHLNLAEYAAVLMGAEQVIANDTGPMHLAAATNDNVLGIFGSSDPNNSRPWGADFIGQRGQWPEVSAVIKKIGA